MIQARLSAGLSSVLTWIFIISVTFGFCASWSLHFVGMLACKLDLPIGLNLGITIFTGLLAVTFTFVALGADLLWRYYKGKATLLGDESGELDAEADYPNSYVRPSQEDSRPLLDQDLEDDFEDYQAVTPNSARNRKAVQQEYSRAVQNETNSHAATANFRDIPSPVIQENGVDDTPEPYVSSTTLPLGTSESRSSFTQRDSNLGGRYDLKGMAYQGIGPTQNAFVATYQGIYSGMCWKAVWMGLLWSLSLTCMHYGGLSAMQIPGGFLTLYPPLVIMSAIISWVVCIIGYIYMVNIEPHLTQQVLFSTVAALGIAAMHFTGKCQTNYADGSEY
jgi:NO-binding membrane sensor protein with MHYT domain